MRTSHEHPSRPELLDRSQQAGIDFLKTDFELSLTFLDIAWTELEMEDASAARRAIEKAEKAYSTIISFLPGVKDTEIREEIRREALELRYELDALKAR